MREHPTQTDKHGVNLDRINYDNERVSDKEFGIVSFKAIVVAYYGKSQMVDVSYVRDGNLGFLSGVEVYGDHGDLLGAITTPDIGIEKTDEGYNLDPPESSDRVEIGERKNNIECIVHRTVDGFAALGFRALNEDNPMWLNSKAGRTITAYSDGAYYVHDKDGNSEFVHPGGLRIKIGDSPDPIVLEDDMGVHQANKSKYPTKTHYIIEHPALSAKIGFDNTGKLLAENSAGKLGTDVLIAIIGEIKKIIVNNGTGPDIPLLEAIEVLIDEIYV